MGRRVGILESAFIIHLGGAVLAGVRSRSSAAVTWLARGAAVRPLGGGLGVVLVCAVSYIVPRIGIATAVSLLVAAQLGVGVALDHYGLLGLALRPVEPARLAMALLLVGAWLVLR
jgi:transporter family-2 protein